MFPLRYSHRNKYNGNWKNEKPHGLGTFKWANGTKYIGDWEFGNGNAVKRPKLTQQNTWSLIDREEAHQSTIKLAMRLNNFSIDDYPRLIMINALLGGTFISRITTNIREDKGYSYSPISQLSVDKKYCFVHLDVYL